MQSLKNCKFISVLYCFCFYTEKISRVLHGKSTEPRGLHCGWINCYMLEAFSGDIAGDRDHCFTPVLKSPAVLLALLLADTDFSGRSNLGIELPVKEMLRDYC